MAKSKEETRAYQKAWHRARAARRVAEANMLATTCQARLTRTLICGTTLRSRFVKGETVPFCVRCDKRARGLCIDCDQPVRGHRMVRCAPCQRLARQAQGVACQQRRHAQGKGYQKSDEQRADAIEYSRLLRQLKADRLRETQRKHYEKHRERYAAWGKAYRARHREKILARKRMAWRDPSPTHPCLECAAPISGRAKKCDACKASQRAHAKAVLTERVQAWEARRSAGKLAA